MCLSVLGQHFQTPPQPHVPMKKKKKMKTMTPKKISQNNYNLKNHRLAEGWGTGNKIGGGGIYHISQCLLTSLHPLSP